MAELKFFFYGSLSENLVHYEKIKNFVLHSEPAQIQGTAYRLPVGYPAVLQTGRDRILGSLMTLEVTELLLNLLDQFHGFATFDESKSLYFRRDTLAQTEHETVLAQAYFMNPSKLPKGAKLIVDGDWRTSLERDEPLTHRLTERQKEYLARLNAISGREIVPINDLTLYRELMKLELIVDKGRRLALSKLGHEVCRYLE